MEKIRFDITGMTCSACQAHIEKAVSALPGVTEVSVNLLKNSMDASFDGAITSEAKIIATVEKTGYGASVHTTGHRSDTNIAIIADPIAQELIEMKGRLIISLLFTLPLFYLVMGPMVGLPLPTFFVGAQNSMSYAFTQFLFAIPVVWVNSKYYRSGFKSLFAGSPNMDALIAIGSGAAMLYSIYGIYKIGLAMSVANLISADHFAAHLYFDSAAMILALITLGKYFEARAKGKTSDAISKLMDLAPKSATVRRDGTEQVIASDEVRVGDIVVVKAGETVPVDGIITEGTAFIDESALTGESVPSEKSIGDKVTGATINKAGHFLMQATRVGEDTTLAQIVKLVDDATSSKAPIARLADKISGVFVPIVIVIAIVAVITWLLLGYDVEFALTIGIAVLVISCPCALGLATPTAIMVGTGRGAANGILFKSAQAIETTQAINSVILDKTGTITEGKPVVTDIIVAHSSSNATLLSVAASLEKLSEHPLGQAIVQESEKQQLPLSVVSDFTQTAGQGITGRIDGEQYFAGNIKMMQAQQIVMDNEITKQAESLAADGKTPLYFADKQQLLGIIAVADVIKKTSYQAVKELEAMGLEVIMITGDNAKTAAAIQKQAGIKQILADVLPQDKEQAVRQLQQQGKRVAMIGDGVNDAPALARADVGIAIGAGTDIAIESADIVLMKSDLLDAVTAIQLSRAVMRNIRQNLFWAFFYNSAGIPVAAGLFFTLWGITLNPMIAAAAMSLSSVSVVGNALRLRFFKAKHHATDSVQSNNMVTKRTHLEIKVVEQQNSHTDIITQKKTNQPRSQIMEKQIKIEGMSCAHCSGRVEKALGAISGVNETHVDLATQTATVKIDTNVNDEMLKRAVTDAGYEVVNIS